jgi:hypothetical protein
MKTARGLGITLLVLGICGCATTSHDSRRSTSSGDGSNSDAAWALFDANGDGDLSFDELDLQHAVGLLRDMRVADTNNDGKVSRAEWNAWWPLMTKTETSPSMISLNASAAPGNGMRAR